MHLVVRWKFIRLPAFGGLSGRLRNEPGGWNPADAVPGGSRARNPDGTGQGVQGDDRPLGDRQRLPEGAQDSFGHFEQQLSHVRRESQHGRAAGEARKDGLDREHRVPRPGAPFEPGDVGS